MEKELHSQEDMRRGIYWRTTVKRVCKLLSSQDRKTGSEAGRRPSRQCPDPFYYLLVAEGGCTLQVYQTAVTEEAFFLNSRSRREETNFNISLFLVTCF